MKPIAFIALVGFTVTSQTAFRLSQRNGEYEYNTFSVMAVVELIKLMITLIHHYRCTKIEINSTFETLRKVSSSMIINYALCAAWYGFYHQLFFACLKDVDPGTFSIFISQTPAIVSFMNWLFFNQCLSIRHWGCILIQIYGVILLLLPEAGKNIDNTYVALIFIAISMRSLNVVYHTIEIKEKELPIQVQNILLYSFGCIFNLSFYAIHKDPAKSFFSGYENPTVMIVIFLNSFARVAVTTLHKSEDDFLKTMSQAASSAILICLSLLFFEMKLNAMNFLGVAAVITGAVTFLKLPASNSRKNEENVTIKKIRMIAICHVFLAMNILTRLDSSNTSLLNMREVDEKLPIVLIVQALKIRDVERMFYLPDDKKLLLEQENKEKLAIFQSYGTYFHHVIIDTPTFLTEPQTMDSNISPCLSKTNIASHPTGENVSCLQCDIDFERGPFDKSRYACISKAMKDLNDSFGSSVESLVEGILVIHADFFLLPTFVITAKQILENNPDSFWLANASNAQTKYGLLSSMKQHYRLTNFDLSLDPSEKILDGWNIKCTKCKTNFFNAFDSARQDAMSWNLGDNKSLSPIWTQPNDILWSDLYYIPKRLWKDFFTLAPIFQKHHVVNELAIGGILSYANFLMDKKTKSKEKATPHIEHHCAGNCCTDIPLFELSLLVSTHEKPHLCGHKVNLGDGKIRRLLIDAWGGIHPPG